MSYLPSYLHHRPLSTASALIALYAVGGLLYAITAPRLIAPLDECRMVFTGGLLKGRCFLVWCLSPPWIFASPIALALGFSTYVYHNTLQTHGTQMAPAMRGTSVALSSSSLFAGQALGVTASGWAVDHIGYGPVLLAANLALPTAAWELSAVLRRRAAPSATLSPRPGHSGLMVASFVQTLPPILSSVDLPRLPAIH